MISDPAIDAMLKQARASHNSGQLQQAERAYRQILAKAPLNADALHLLGVIALQTGHAKAGAELVSRAIAVNPSGRNFHLHLSILLHALGDSPQAIDAAKTAVTLAPDDVNAQFNLGNILQQSKRFPEASKAYRAALQINGPDAKILNNLAMTLDAQGLSAEALEACKEAVRIQPNEAPLQCNLGNALLAASELEPAVEAYRNAIALDPNNGIHFSNLARLLPLLRRFDEAIHTAEEALKLSPNLPSAYYDLGCVYSSSGHQEKAIANYNKALELKPDYVEAMINLGLVYKEKGDYEHTREIYNNALTIRPKYPTALNNLALLFNEVGQAEEAVKACRQAVDLNPNAANYLSNLIMFMHYLPKWDGAGLRDALSEWNDQHARPLAPLIAPHENNRDPERKLRIGYVSSDFRNNAVGWFMLPLLANHNHDAMEIFGYANSLKSDAWTHKLSAHTNHWREVFNLSDDKLATMIRADKIDILVDLTMHTSGGRLLTFARKPAPIQVTYLAIPSTTGLHTIDYRFTDPYLDPPGAGDQRYSEQSIRLPATFWCYNAPPEAPPVSPPPAVTEHKITFGSFNNFCKVTGDALKVWSRLLLQVPESRLLIYIPKGLHRKTILDDFADNGVTSHRIEFFSALPLADYFAQYGKIDIALDPFPYAGGTTTCDTLWMGVPVVSMCGEAAVSRSGMSILSNVGLSGLVASSPEQYLQIAIHLALDIPRLIEMRSGMRERMQASPLMDAPRFARDVESAYRAMWRRWCATR